MQEERLSSGPLRFKDPRREAMLEPEEVSTILRLNELGWGAKRISRELGISRNTPKDYIAAGGWTSDQPPQRTKARDGQEAWLREGLRRQCGTAAVTRQELAADKGIIVSLPTVDARCNRIGMSLRPRRARRCGLRRRLASSCRSAGARFARICSLPRSAIRAGIT